MMEAVSPLPADVCNPAPGTFDVDRLEHSSLASRLINALALYPRLQRVLDLARWFTPVWRVPFLGLTLVLRYDGVREVLSNSRQFPVPWGWKMKLVTSDPQRAANSPTGDGGGRNFVLGMKVADGPYQQDYRLLAHAFAYGDVRKTVGDLARQATEAALARWADKGTDQPFDVVEELVIGVPTALCESYYGIPIADKPYFAKCTLAVSSFLFGPAFEENPQGSAAEDMQRALDAAAPLRHTIRSALRGARAAADQGAVGGNDTRQTPLQRMVHGPGRLGTVDEIGTVDDDRIHVQLFGMVLGFIPTNVLAAGNLLETLLRKPDFMARAVAAARAGDDERLWRCLRETLRFRNINFGPLRVCAEACDLPGDNGRSTRIEAGTKVLACTQSAMFDKRQVQHPHLFDSDRPDEDYLVFGVGQHWCIGAYIAIAQITQMFKVLLSTYELKPVPGAAGKMKRFNVFPLRMQVQMRKWP